MIFDPTDPGLVEPVRVLASDDPWPFRDGLPGNKRGARKNYKLMPLHEIMRFPLPPIAKDAVLFLWRVGAMQEEALQVVRARGFVPKSQLTWIKTAKCGQCQGEPRRARSGARLMCMACGGLGQRPVFMMGRYTRWAQEDCLVATRGSCMPTWKAQRSFFYAPMPVDDKGETIHSAKPDEFFRIVDRMYPDGARVSLFDRVERGGKWFCYGDELSRAHPGAPLR